MEPTSLQHSFPSERRIIKSIVADQNLIKEINQNETLSISRRVERGI
jgi:hypothetical protein